MKTATYLRRCFMATITLNSSGEQAELICFGMGMVRSFLLGLILLTKVLSWKSTLTPSMIIITGCLFQPCWMFNLISFKRTFRQSLENRGRLRPLSMTSLRGAPSGVISLNEKKYVLCNHNIPDVSTSFEP